ncbi:hypothetical protein RYH73_20205 [Olivibacter sp. CPCC 100613]|uniref:hypothetical protein n=1 Tax=Olivibacter sp. CPCC 100613 TaxID=3079931 RepID=UPI002FF533DD
MKLTLASIFTCFIFLALYGQQTNDSSEKVTYTLAALYKTNIDYYGQVTEEKLPYILLNGTVQLPFGMYFSASSYKFLNYGSGIAGTDLSVGYDYGFSDRFSTGIMYTHSFYPSNSPLLQASLTSNINGSASYNWTWFKSALNIDYAFGHDSDVFLTLSHSKDINLGNLFTEAEQISFEPSLELIAGTRNYYETYIRAKNQRGQEMGNGKPPDNPGNSGDKIEYVPSKSFSMLSYNMKLPISYSYGNYLAELSYQLSLIAPSEEGFKRAQSFFGIAFYYQF